MLQMARALLNNNVVQKFRSPVTPNRQQAKSGAVKQNMSLRGCPRMRYFFQDQASGPEGLRPGGEG